MLSQIVHEEREAASRFFDNDNVSRQEILQPHMDATRERDATRKRISQSGFVLLVLAATLPIRDVGQVGAVVSRAVQRLKLGNLVTRSVSEGRIAHSRSLPHVRFFAYASGYH